MKPVFASRCLTSAHQLPTDASTRGCRQSVHGRNGRRPGVSVANEQSKSRKIRLKTIEDP